MRRFDIRGAAIIALTILTAAGLTACTFDDGNPSASVQGQLTAAFNVPEDRVAASGAVKTATDFELIFENIEVEFGPMEIVQSAAVAAVEFDPSDPPAGYSLCHNGHCHADAGELVDYEDIVSEIAEEQGITASRTRVLSSANGTIWETSFATDFNDCPNGRCPLQQAPLTGVDVVISSITLSLSVTDTRTGDRRRIDDYTLNETFVVAATVSGQLDGAVVDYHSDNAFTLLAELEISPRIFDSVDWVALGSAPSGAEFNDAGAALRDALNEVVINARISRRSF